MAAADSREFRRLQIERDLDAQEVRWAGLVALAASSPAVPMPEPEPQVNTPAPWVRTYLKYNHETKVWEDKEIW